MTGDSRGREVARASSSPGAPFNFCLFRRGGGWGGCVPFSCRNFRWTLRASRLNDLIDRDSPQMPRYGMAMGGVIVKLRHQCSRTCAPCAFLFESVTTESPAIQTPDMHFCLRCIFSFSRTLDKEVARHAADDQSCAVKSKPSRNTRKKTLPRAAFLNNLCLSSAAWPIITTRT